MIRFNFRVKAQMEQGRNRTLGWQGWAKCKSTLQISALYGYIISI